MIIIFMITERIYILKFYQLNYLGKKNTQGGIRTHNLTLEEL